MKKLLYLVMLTGSSVLYAASPTCDDPGETYVSWPSTGDPVWEMCYLAPNQSSAAQGSSLEIRDVHYNGHLMLERGHVPMLFANYVSGTCYRDWKDVNSAFLAADQVENPSRVAITACDASSTETGIVQNCPYVDVENGGNVGDGSDCTTGVQVEKHPGYLLLTANHSAAWYKYSSRYYFYLNGTIEPRFGFGNSDGTGFNSTHRHHAYWRWNFDINGPENDQVFVTEGQTDTVQNDEFWDFRDEQLLISWKVIDSETGRGVEVIPTLNARSENGSTINDYNMPADESGDGYHEVDVMTTRYRLFNNGTLPEYSDTPGSNSLGNCSMDETQLVNGETLVDENVVFWYRTAVKDLAGQGMVCKTGGPSIVPIGDWSRIVPGVQTTAQMDYSVSELGDTLDLEVRLTTLPTDDVTIDIVSSDTSEGTVDTAQLTFTPGNWDQAQIIQVTGQDDGDFDDDVVFEIQMTASSNDTDYDGVQINAVEITNIDDEVASDIIFENGFE